MSENARKKILFITGTRADFGKLKPLMRAVEDSDGFECHIFATGMHQLKKYGQTIKEIKKEHFSNLFPYFNQTTDTSMLMDITLAETIKGISYYVSENSVDLLVVHGDRIEALAGAIVGAMQGIRTAHVEGGERSGTIDETIRHAVSKLSHIHFTATEANRKRLIQMGENENNIYVIGSPDIDIMLNENLPSLENVKNHYGITYDRYSIFIYHPVTSELNNLKYNIRQVIDGLLQTCMNYIVIYPNNDPGSDIILKEINGLQGRDNFAIFSSIRFERFLVLLKNASCIIGNSSCGIHEAPVYGIPTINIGSRQKNRFTCPTITNIEEDKRKIINAIHNLPESCSPIFAYGSGNSAAQFISILSGSEIWHANLQKHFFDQI